MESSLPLAVLDTNVIVRILISPYRSDEPAAGRLGGTRFPIHNLRNKVASDLEDNMVVCCALEAGAEYVVTDDRRDLLPLKVIRCAGYRPVQIVSPLAFLRLLGQPPPAHP